MLDHKDVILYVGKAKNLPNRLKSYVAEKNHIIRTARMLSQTFKLEITTTANESEALLLEANLIKKHKPKFNILLKDDKSFPFVFISNKDQWAQVTKHRGKKDKEGFYFGPKVKSFFILFPSMFCNLCPLVFITDKNKGKRFVILEQYIEFRFMFFY